METIRILADVNIEMAIIDYLRKAGYDTKWVPDYNCQMSDGELLDMARREGRVLITNDKDFGEMVFLQKRLSAGVILLRIKSQKTKAKIAILIKLLENYGNRVSGNFIVLSKDKIRVIPMEDIR